MKDRRETILFLENNVVQVAPALDGFTLEVYLKDRTDAISLEPTRLRFFSGEFLDLDLEVTDKMQVAKAEGLDHGAVVAVVKEGYLGVALSLVIRTLKGSVRVL